MFFPLTFSEDRNSIWKQSVLISNKRKSEYETFQIESSKTTPKILIYRLVSDGIQVVVHVVLVSFQRYHWQLSSIKRSMFYWYLLLIVCSHCKSDTFRTIDCLKRFFAALWPSSRILGHIEQFLKRIFSNYRLEGFSDDRSGFFKLLSEDMFEFFLILSGFKKISISP